MVEMSDDSKKFKDGKPSVGMGPSMKNAKVIIHTLSRLCGKHWIGRTV
jgi:hypothetical protein